MNKPTPKIYSTTNWSKGGVGKTTVVTNLLIGFQQKGKSILIDTDEQQSSMRWSKQRNDINS